MNVEKLHGLRFDRIILVATSPSAVAACQRAIDALVHQQVELMTWLDIG